MTTAPAAYDSKKVPALLWREQWWPVPDLAARQLEEIYEPIERISKELIAQGEDAVLDEETATPEQKLARGLNTLGKLYKLPRERFADLRECVFIGLTRAHPGLPREEYDDAPAAPAELLAAFFVVRKASRMYEIDPRAPKTEEKANTGEA